MSITSISFKKELQARWRSSNSPAEQAKNHSEGKEIQDSESKNINDLSKLDRQ